ncbi:MAG TPA: glycosyltransferase [Terriglobales bacterium]|nr:glycosyltransferase [Terriglobales bacterium]
MKIALLGTRGIPNRYGGFEAFYEKLSQYLVNDGHEVTVYCRHAFTRPEDDTLVDSRIRRVILPSISAKHLDTPVHTFLSVLHVIFTRADIVLMCNVANSPVAWIPRLFGKPVVLNVDGLDRQRKKWGPLARIVLSICEFFSVFTPSKVVTDSLTMQGYYRSRYRKSSVMIGYGAEPPERLQTSPENSVLKRFGLEPKKYVLYVSRLEPENNPELVIRAYEKTKIPWPLVMVGSNAYDPAYEQRLRSLASERVIFTGSIYGNGYWEFQLNAACFVFACEVGGIHPALVEAMSAGNPVLYLNIESNRETAADCGVVFEHSEDDLAAKLQNLFHDPKLLADLALKGAQRARERYGWGEVTRQYENLFEELFK